MKFSAVIIAFITVAAAAVPHSRDTAGMELFPRQENCRKADEFCNDNDPFPHDCCKGLKCKLENDPVIGRTKVCR
ncbi:hypothetical protein CKAH01_14683 [Colletotrichum kahawae]|uniref:Uncharacterized protein n=1 Tax=Colletotrichum kahawae TaxID=34407 RepID=A0AAE0D9X3_COLKA|nr:hypothetical protein CKAH01_14683 [Colletotrichum kahawae]